MTDKQQSNKATTQHKTKTTMGAGLSRSQTLFDAVDKGDVYMVKQLVRWHPTSVEINKVDAKTNSTPLMRAIYCKEPRMVAALLKHPGIDVNFPLFITPLEYAASFACSASIVKLLLDHPAIDEGEIAVMKDRAAKGQYIPEINQIILAKDATPVAGAAGAATKTKEPPSLAVTSFVASQLLELELLRSATCPIAFTPLERGASAVTSCGHVFSREALAESFEHFPGTCPTCRHVSDDPPIDV